MDLRKNNATIRTDSKVNPENNCTKNKRMKTLMKKSAQSALL